MSEQSITTKGKGWFPKYLTAPIQFFVWEVDEIFPFLALFTMGFIFGGILILSMIGAFLSWLVIKHKEYLPEGFLGNLAYMVGIRDIPGYPSYLAGEFRE